MLEGCGMKWGGSQAGKRRKEGRTYGKQRPAEGGGSEREVLGCRVSVACACVFGGALQRRQLCLLAGVAAKTGGGGAKIGRHVAGRRVGVQ